jgi:AraC-like DNA-binding protein
MSLKVHEQLRQRNQPPPPPDPILAAEELRAERIAEKVAMKILAHLPKPAPRLLNRQELARELGVSAATVDRQTAAGKLPFVTIGDQKRYELDRCIEASRSVAAK